MNILITGGSGGVGKAIYTSLFGHSLTTLGLRDCDIQCDLAYADTIHKALEGREFDYVIHCAGSNHIVPHSDLQEQQIELLTRINAISNFTINKLLLDRGLQAAVHIISDAAWTPMTHSLAYNVSKAAQLMVMRQMAHETKDCIICGVSPGKIANTGMSDYIDHTFPPMRGLTYAQGREYQLSRLKTGELQPHQVADFVSNIVNTMNRGYHGHNFTIGG